MAGWETLEQHCLLCGSNAGKLEFPILAKNFQTGNQLYRNNMKQGKAAKTIADIAARIREAKVNRSGKMEFSIERNEPNTLEIMAYDGVGQLRTQSLATFTEPGALKNAKAACKLAGVKVSVLF